MQTETVVVRVERGWENSDLDLETYQVLKNCLVILFLSSNIVIISRTYEQKIKAFKGNNFCVVKYVIDTEGKEQIWHILIRLDDRIDDKLDNTGVDVIIGVTGTDVETQMLKTGTWMQKNGCVAREVPPVPCHSA